MTDANGTANGTGNRNDNGSGTGNSNGNGTNTALTPEEKRQIALEEARRKAQEAADRRRQEEADRKRKAALEADRIRQAQLEAERRRKAEAARSRNAEAERRRNAEAARRRNAEAERKRRQREDAERRRQEAETARKRKAREEAARKRKAREEAARKRKAREEAERKRKQTEEAARKRQLAARNQVVCPYLVRRIRNTPTTKRDCGLVAVDLLAGADERLPRRHQGLAQPPERRARHDHHSAFDQTRRRHILPGFPVNCSVWRQVPPQHRHRLPLRQPLADRRLGPGQTAPLAGHLTGSCRHGITPEKIGLWCLVPACPKARICGQDRRIIRSCVRCPPVRRQDQAENRRGRIQGN